MCLPFPQGTCTLSTYGYASATIHPLQLFNVQPLSGTPTPIIYNSASPSPSTVPGGALNYPPYQRRKRDGLANFVAPSEATITPSPSISQLELKRRAAAPPLPTWLATTYPPSRISSACSCVSVSASSTTTLTFADYTQVTVSNLSLSFHSPRLTTASDVNLHGLHPHHRRNLRRHLRPQPASQCAQPKQPRQLPRRPLVSRPLEIGLLRRLHQRLQLCVVEV